MLIVVPRFLFVRAVALAESPQYHRVLTLAAELQGVQKPGGPTD
jgi:hypothetical protein